jgi:hypothetical protein
MMTHAWDLTCATATISWEAESQGRRSAVVEVLDLTTGGIIVKTPERLTVGLTVFLSWDHKDRRASVTHCEERGSGFFVSLHFLNEERRREDRLISAGSGRLHWTDRAGQHIAIVEVQNVTEEGLQVMVNEGLPHQQTVRLSGETWECIGDVCYCRTEGRKFVAGIQLRRRPYLKNSVEYFD